MTSDKSSVPSDNRRLEKLLTEVVNFGNALLDPSTSDTELLRLLDEFELCLSGIHQGEAEKFLSSLGPLKEALIDNPFIRHANADVQISVLSCITEITRITAPEWPYEQCKMKEFFLLLVQSLKNFSSMNVHCYTKAASILETVAGVKSCMIMLDLNMNGPILEMFQNFLFSIQSRPTFDVFSDMVTIMTTLIQELKEDGSIPVDLLSTLLTSVKMDKKDGSPISWAMGVKILQTSAEHVRPFLKKLVQSMEINLNDYAEIVTSICQDAAQVENMVYQELASDSVAPNGQLVDGLSKSLTNNFTSQDMDNGISCEQSSLKIQQGGSQIAELTLTENVAVERDYRPSKDENSLEDLNSSPTKEKNTADLKTVSEVENVNLVVLEEHNPGAQGMDRGIISEENVSKTLKFDNHSSKPPLTNDVSSKSGNLSPLKDDNSLKEQTSGGMAIQIDTNAGTTSLADNVNVNNDVSQDNNDDIEVTEKRERKPNSLFKREEGYLLAGRFDQIGFSESSCGWKNHKQRTTRSSARRSNSVSLGNKSFSDEKPHRKRTMKKISEIVNQHDSETKELSSASLSARGKRRRDKSSSSSKHDQEFDVVLASLFSTKPATESEYKGNSSALKEQASQMTFGEKLVGRKIKVWWPLDRKYYEGSINSYDLSTMKHKVMYDDGDVEMLNLMAEDWHLVKASASLDGQENVQGPASSDQNVSDGPPSKKQKDNCEGENIPEAAAAAVAAGASVEKADN